MTSGIGLAIANTTAFAAIERIPATLTAPGCESPIKTSAPASALSAEPMKFSGFVVSA